MNEFDAIIVVDHGSRREEANLVVVEIAERLQARRPDVKILPAHCELGLPTLIEVIEACVASGARRILVQPYYLVPGRHTTEDIPRIVGEEARRHPEATFQIGDPLGVGDPLVDQLEARIDQKR